MPMQKMQVKTGENLCWRYCALGITLWKANLKIVETLLGLGGAVFVFVAALARQALAVHRALEKAHLISQSSMKKKEKMKNEKRSRKQVFSIIGDV